MKRFSSQYMGALCGKCVDEPVPAEPPGVTIPAHAVVAPLTAAALERKTAVSDKSPTLLSDLTEPPTAGSPRELPDLELAAAALGESFSFDGEQVDCKVVSVYDGDTVTAVFRFRGILTQWKLRMQGYDSPEMKQPKNKPEPARSAAKSAAIAARDALSALVLNKVVSAQLGGFDKYGRILADLFPVEAPDGVTAFMLRNHYGVVYHGGKKATDPV